MSEHPEIVMFLEIVGLDEPDWPEAREVSAVPAVGETIWVTFPYGSVASVKAREGMHRIIGRHWQWDRSGRVRVIVTAGKIET